MANCSIDCDHSFKESQSGVFLYCGKCGLMVGIEPEYLRSAQSSTSCSSSSSTSFQSPLVDAMSNRRSRDSSSSTDRRLQSLFNSKSNKVPRLELASSVGDTKDGVNTTPEGGVTENIIRRDESLTSSFFTGDRIAQRRAFTEQLLGSPGMTNVRSVLNESSSNAEKVLLRSTKIGSSKSKKQLTLTNALNQIEVGAVVMLSEDAPGKKVKSDQTTLQLAVDNGLAFIVPANGMPYTLDDVNIGDLIQAHAESLHEVWKHPFSICRFGHGQLAEKSGFISSNYSDMNVKAWFVSHIPLNMHNALSTGSKSKFSEALKRYSHLSNLLCHEDGDARVIFVISEKCFELKNSRVLYKESIPMPTNSEVTITTNPLRSDNELETTEQCANNGNVQLRNATVAGTTSLAQNQSIGTSMVKRPINLGMASAFAESVSSSMTQTHVPDLYSEQSDCEPDDAFSDSYLDSYYPLPVGNEETRNVVPMVDLTHLPVYSHPSVSPSATVVYSRLYRDQYYDEHSVANFVNRQFQNALEILDSDVDAMVLYVSGGYYDIDEKNVVKSVTTMFLDKVVNNPFSAALIGNVIKVRRGSENDTVDLGGPRKAEFCQFLNHVLYDLVGQPIVAGINHLWWSSTSSVILKDPEHKDILTALGGMLCYSMLIGDVWGTKLKFLSLFHASVLNVENLDDKHVQDSILSFDFINQCNLHDDVEYSYMKAILLVAHPSKASVLIVLQHYEVNEVVAERMCNTHTNGEYAIGSNEYQVEELKKLLLRVMFFSDMQVYLMTTVARGFPEAVRLEFKRQWFDSIQGVYKKPIRDLIQYFSPIGSLVHSTEGRLAYASFLNVFDRLCTMDDSSTDLDWFPKLAMYWTGASALPSPPYDNGFKLCIDVVREEKVHFSACFNTLEIGVTLLIDVDGHNFNNDSVLEYLKTNLSMTLGDIRFDGDGIR